MVMLIIVVAAWIVVAPLAGVGVGRVIAKADVTSERVELMREYRSAGVR